MFEEQVYIVDDELGNHNWVLEDGNKQYLGFSCKKASLIFRGRKYEAWYTEEINTPAGPWKFFGLPGLILEIRDDNNYIHFRATKIELDSSRKELPSFNHDGVKITWLDYQILKIQGAQRMADSMMEDFNIGKVIIKPLFENTEILSPEYYKK